MPGKPGPQEGVRRTQEIADDMRKLIQTGEWSPGDVLPTQKELATRFGTGGPTISRALGILKREGLVEGGQGRRYVVATPELTHQLVLNPRGIFDDRWRPVEALGPPRFTQREGTGEATTHWTTGRVDVSWPIASLFGFERGAATHERAMLLAIGDEPVLTSVSYLSAELAGDDEDGEGGGGGEQWRDVEVAQLALTGHEIEEAAPSALPRSPTSADLAILNIDRNVLVHALYQPYRVRLAERTVPAGVVVTARSDLVYLR